MCRRTAFDTAAGGNYTSAGFIIYLAYYYTLYIIVIYTYPPETQARPT